MRTTALLLLGVLTALAEHHDNKYSRLAKRELLIRSKRRWVLSTIEVVEEDPGPFPKQISQMYNDKFEEGKGHKFSISGHGVDEEPRGVFSIDANNGKVYAHKAIDREILDKFHIKFDVLDKDSGSRLDKELAFDVEIKDINDNAPQFDRYLLRANVKESYPEGYLPVQLRATDKDQENTLNSTVTISVLSQKPDEPKFSIEQFDERNAQLKFTGCFNYDTAKGYSIMVEAKDQGMPPLSSTATIILGIEDTNTHPPVFKQNTYKGEVLEMATHEEVLRVAVEDKDKPNTPGWRANYYFISGNEDGNYKIVTDPKTNEGILSVIKGKDFERTTFTNLQIGVENEEKLFICPGKTPATPPPPNTVNITIKVIDVNDPPHFDKDTADVYQKEEESPGKVLFVPTVHDVDSDVDKIRFELIDDPADWVTLDPKTGKVTSTKKMDRESPFVNENNIYKVLVAAIDNGEPPATGTCTIQIHLGDINDHVPKLANTTLIMCGNKKNKVTVAVNDLDAHPFSGPFAFSVGGTDKTLKQRWKLDPNFGEEGVLISVKPLPYGNYSVPLVIQDQQNMVGQETLVVLVCNCGKGEDCLKKDPLTLNLGGAAVGLIMAGLFLFLLLLLLFMCQCGKKFQAISLMQDEGNQTLIKYNQEGGSSECKAEPTLLLSPTTTMTVTDSIKQSNMQHVMAPPVMSEEIDYYSNTMYSRNNEHYMNSLGMQNQRDSMRNGGWNRFSSYHTNKSTMRGASRYGRSFSLQANQQIEDHLYRKIQMIAMNNVDDPLYDPHEYAYEGQGSRCQSLDKLSLSNWGDDLQFLNDLGPKFKTLGGICQQTIQEKNIQL